MNCHSEVTEARNLDRRLWISAALNVGITVVELVGGILAGSLALLAARGESQKTVFLVNV
jgi:Co/Zn/Cd efflux system component